MKNTENNQTATSSDLSVSAGYGWTKTRPTKDGYYLMT